MTIATAENITNTESNKSIDALKTRQKATWEDGDYARFARYMENGAIEIVNDWKLNPGDRLLDVACGAGQTALPAARKGLAVTGIDIAKNLVDAASARARAEQVDARFDEGDAEDLPYASADFDVAITMFGAMFAPRPDKVANELARVLRPGGKLYMCNWTTRSMPAQMFKAVAKRVPPPPGFIPPTLWGDEETVKSRLAGHFTDIELVRKIYPQWHYDFSSKELVNFFRSYFGPVKRAFAAVDADEQQKLFEELHAIYNNHSTPYGNDGITIHGEYLEVIATKR